MASEKFEMNDIVVLIPGILGSVLEKDGKEIWGLSAGAFINAIRNLGSDITDLAFPDHEINNPAYDDGVTASRLLPDAHLIPWFWKIDGYGLISNTLQEKFNLTPGENYFEFPYDWRRDNRLAARRLKAESDIWLKNWREKSGNSEAKLILVAHSMGGLISRYFLEVLDGWRDTRKLITFATPYAGALNALDAICNGLQKKVGFVKIIDLTQMVRSFPSVYQLLPTFACWDDGTGTNLHLNELGVSVPNLDMERVQDVFEFRREIDDALTVNNKNFGRDRYLTLPIVGLRQPTTQSVQPDGTGIEILQTLGAKDTSGDGTVPRIAATPPEWTADNRQVAVFIAERHASLQNNDAALQQLISVLEKDDFELFKGPDSTITLQIDDAYGTEEVIQARAKSGADDDLIAELVNADTNQTIATKPFDHSQGIWQTVEFAPPLPAGKYRMIVSEKAMSATPVTDIFLVA